MNRGATYAQLEMGARQQLKLFFAKKLLSVIVWFEDKPQYNNYSVAMGTRLHKTTSEFAMRKTFRKPSRWILVLLGAFFVAATLLVAFINFGSSREQNVLFIAPAKGSWHLAKELEKAEIISSPILFRIAAALRFGNLRAGEYKIYKDDSYTDIIAKAIKGRSVRYRFTIPEGRTNHDIMEVLRVNTLLKGAIGKMPEEGTLLPETYFIHRGKYRTQIIRQMHAEHNRLVKKLWQARTKDLPLKAMKDAVILASIVEKETGIDGERKEVAGVFINRLNKNSYMQLQSDPTVIYALARGKPFERSLVYADLKTDDPYNTYKNYGLPPGAISNPGRAALEAVMNPMKTEHFYFVADGSGGHVFAKTYEQHLENVKKWRVIQNGAENAEENEDDKNGKVVENKEESTAKN